MIVGRGVLPLVAACVPAPTVETVAAQPCPPCVIPSASRDGHGVGSWPLSDEDELEAAVEEAASVDAAQSRAERPRSPPVAIISLISSDSEASVDYP